MLYHVFLFSVLCRVSDDVIFRLCYSMVVNLDCSLFSIVSNLNKSNLETYYAISIAQ